MLALIYLVKLKNSMILTYWISVRVINCLTDNTYNTLFYGSHILFDIPVLYL